MIDTREVETNGKRKRVKPYQEILLGRGTLTQEQVDTWTVIERIAEKAGYQAGYATTRLLSASGMVRNDEEAEYIAEARARLQKVLRAVGPDTAGALEFVVILGEDIPTYAQRKTGWNRHQIIGSLRTGLDVAKIVLKNSSCVR